MGLMVPWVYIPSFKAIHWKEFEKPWTEFLRHYIGAHRKPGHSSLHIYRRKKWKEHKICALRQRIWKLNQILIPRKLYGQNVRLRVFWSITSSRCDRSNSVLLNEIELSPTRIIWPKQFFNRTVTSWDMN